MCVAPRDELRRRGVALPLSSLSIEAAASAHVHRPERNRRHRRCHPLAEIAPALVKGQYNVVEGAIRKPNGARGVSISGWKSTGAVDNYLTSGNTGWPERLPDLDRTVRLK